MKRIAIVGISGSGKSTLARKLGEKTGLPVFHMDPLFWRGNWEAVNEAETLVMHKELIAKDKWIIEGWIDVKMASRLEVADLVIYLDYSGALCAWRVVKRWWKHRKESRPELPSEAKDKFLPRYFKTVFTRGERDHIENAIKLIDELKIVRFHSPRQLERFIQNRL
jgi:adenylate kinase family enzyme